MIQGVGCICQEKPPHPHIVTNVKYEYDVLKLYDRAPLGNESTITTSTTSTLVCKALKSTNNFAGSNVM